MLCLCLAALNLTRNGVNGEEVRIHFFHVRWLVRASEESGDDVQSYERVRFVSEDDGLQYMDSSIQRVLSARFVCYLRSHAKTTRRKYRHQVEYNYFYVNT